MPNSPDQTTYAHALFAGGCFWCIEAAVRMKEGVTDVISGYAGDDARGARYEDVASHGVLAREAVLVYYDPSKLTYSDLVRHFLSKIDPTDDGGQFFDRGYSYTTCIYYASEEERTQAESVIQELSASGIYDKPLVTRIEPRPYFEPAEEYHQRYSEKNPEHYESYHTNSGRAAYVAVMDAKLNEHDQK